MFFARFYKAMLYGHAVRLLGLHRSQLAADACTHLRNAQVPTVEVGTLPSGEIDYGELQQKLEANRQAGPGPSPGKALGGEFLAAGRYRCWELWSEHGASVQATV